MKWHNRGQKILEVMDLNEDMERKFREPGGVRPKCSGQGFSQTQRKHVVFTVVREQGVIGFVNRSNTEMAVA